MLFYQFFQPGVEFGILAGGDVCYLTLGVYDNLGREALDAVGFVDAVGGVGVVDVDPRQGESLHGALPLFGGVAAIDSYHLELTLIFLICLLEVGETLDTPAAP